MNTIEYFYSAHSAYAYIGHRKLLEISAAHNCRLVHRPIDLRAVVRSAGSLPFDKRTKHNIDYHFGREIERWAEFRGVEILNRRPTYHDHGLNLSNGMLIAAIRQGADIDTLSHAVLRAHWLDDIDLDDADQLRRVATQIGPDYGTFVDQAMDETVQHVHRENTAEAIERGIFGSPTYFLNGDMYYGQDHLELLERGLVHPFKPHTFQNPEPGAPR